MAATFVAICLFCVGSALTLLGSDNQWARDHAWLLPILWWGFGLSGLGATLSSKWFRSIYRRFIVSQESVSRSTANQETHGEASPNITATHGSTINVTFPIQEPSGRVAPKLTLPQFGVSVEGLPLSRIDRGLHSTTLTPAFGNCIRPTSAF